MTSIAASSCRPKCPGQGPCACVAGSAESGVAPSFAVDECAMVAAAFRVGWRRPGSSLRAASSRGWMAATMASMALAAQAAVPIPTPTLGHHSPTTARRHYRSCGICIRERRLVEGPHLGEVKVIVVVAAVQPTHHLSGISVAEVGGVESEVEDQPELEARVGDCIADSHLVCFRDSCF